MKSGPLLGYHREGPFGHPREPGRGTGGTYNGIRLRAEAYLPGNDAQNFYSTPRVTSGPSDKIPIRPARAKLMCGHYYFRITIAGGGIFPKLRSGFSAGRHRRATVPLNLDWGS